MTTTAFATVPPDRERRAEAVREARASVLLEGFAIGPTWDAEAARFVDGKLSLAQFIVAVKGQRT